MDRNETLVIKTQLIPKEKPIIGFGCASNAMQKHLFLHFFATFEEFLALKATLDCTENWYFSQIDIFRENLFPDSSDSSDCSDKGIWFIAE